MSHLASINWYIILCISLSCCAITPLVQFFAIRQQCVPGQFLPGLTRKQKRHCHLFGINIHKSGEPFRRPSSFSTVEQGKCNRVRVKLYAYFQTQADKHTPCYICHMAVLTLEATWVEVHFSFRHRLLLNNNGHCSRPGAHLTDRDLYTNTRIDASIHICIRVKQWHAISHLFKP